MRDSLSHLREVMCAVAAEDTAYSAYDRDRSPLHGHCGAVAHVVQSRLGGAIVGATVMGERHLWNRLEDGTEVDLTSDQFGGDGLHPVTSGRPCPPRKTVNKRFETFAQRVAGQL